MDDPQVGDGDQARDGEPEARDMADLETARELLARTVRFLERCSQDPASATREDDPRELIRGLEALANGPDCAAPAQEGAEDGSRTIPIRHRRSA